MDAPGTTASPPDWETLKLELHCPRCGYNLRGLPQPRCPECGLEFEWGKLIDAAQTGADSPLFEYQWRRRPVRSFLLTVGRAMLPWRLWLHMPIAWEPQVKPLLTLALVALVLWGVCSLGADFASNYFEVWVAFTKYGRRVLWASWSLDFAGRACEALGYVLLGTLIWLSLQVYQQTIGRYRVRQRQLVRVVAFALVGLLAWQVVVVLVATGFWLFWNYSWTFSGTALYQHVGLPTLAVISALPWAIYALSLCLGLNRYLRIRRGWLMGLASIVIVFLVLVTPLPVFIVSTGLPDNSWSRLLTRLWPNIHHLSATLFLGR